MILGDHILYCGDFFRKYCRLPDRSVDLVVTDPPYGVTGRMNPWDIGVDFGHLAGIFNQKLTSVATIALICNARLIPVILQDFRRYFKYRYTEIWKKPSAEVKHKDRPKPDVDFVLVLDRKNAKKIDRIFNWKDIAEIREPYRRVNRNLENATMPTLKREVDENPSGHRYPSTVLEVPNRPAMTSWELEGVTHRQQKSLYHVERLIRLLSHRGQVVLDPFMGSGTTVVAAARCGRTGIGFEVERRFFNQARRRLERALKENHDAVTL